MDVRQHDGCQAQGKGGDGGGVAVKYREITVTDARTGANGFTNASPATSAFGGLTDIIDAVSDFRV